MNSDYYKVLNVTREASPEEIHRAYRMLAFRYHPDRNPTPAAAARMATINEAYEVLREPKKRHVYDEEHTRHSDGVSTAVLRAARDALLKKDWILVQDRGNEFLLRKDTRQAYVILSPALSPTIFREGRQRAAGFCVFLTLRVDPPLGIASNSTAVIDVMHGRIYGSLPDEHYKELFQAFL